MKALLAPFSIIHLRVIVTIALWMSSNHLIAQVCQVSGPSNICSNQEVFFSADYCSTGSSNFWLVNGQIVGSGLSLTYTFTSPGEYSVSYTYDYEVCDYSWDPDSQSYVSYCYMTSDGASLNVTVTTSFPVPELQINKLIICEPSTISLLVANAQAGVTYTWSSSPAGYTATGTTVSFSNVNRNTTFTVVASSGQCSLTTSMSMQYEATGLQPVVTAISTYHKRTLQASIYIPSHYWQTSASGTLMLPSNQVVGPYIVTEPGNYYIRKYSTTGTCWTVASAPVNVTIDYQPPMPAVSLGLRMGYTEGFLNNNDKAHILQYADFYLVSGPSGTETNKNFGERYNFYKPGTYFVRGRDRGTGTWGTAVELVIILLADNSINWVHAKSFDGSPANNVIVSESKSYFDDTGKPLQSQVKSFTDSPAIKVLATQSLRDRYDRVVGSTLPAPILPTDFQYNAGFVLTNAGEPYSHKNFDTDTNRENPEPVNQNMEGTLGWYYSNNNPDKTIPQTNYPYSRTFFYEDGTGEAKKSIGVGDVFRILPGHEVLSGTFPVFDELNDYVDKRTTALPGITQDGSLRNEGVVSIGRDENGKYGISITDKSGRGVMSARKGTPDNRVLEVKNTVVASANPNSADYRPMVYFYILDDQPVSIQMEVPEQNINGIVYGKSIERTTYVASEQQLIASQQIRLMPDFTAPAGSVFRARISAEEVSMAAGGFTLENLVTGQKLASGQTFANGAGVWPAGFYRLIVTGNQSITLSYANYFLDVSYQFYDDVGRLKASVSPNGFNAWKSEPDYALIDKTTYHYNHRGWLLSMTEPDAGRTEYKYRKDGKIRFSQNALQREKAGLNASGTGKFSYTHYDYLGRPFESGEYTGTTVIYGAALNTQLDFADQLSFTEVKDWVRTHYDEPAADFTTVTGLSATDYKQEFMRGAVSWTENENIKTYYSYDELGRVTWMAQKPTGLPRTFVVKYKYDFLGNVLEVANLAYNVQGQKVEEFYHHYLYDKDKRLSQAYTSVDGAAKKLRAKYLYYLHGPLKRIELGNGVQGIDFVYNIHGWLTQINHPDSSRDPGNDGNGNGFRKDAFGMVLEYYESELNLVLGNLEIPKGLDPKQFHKLPIGPDDEMIPAVAYTPAPLFFKDLLQKNLQQLKSQGASGG